MTAAAEMQTAAPPPKSPLVWVVVVSKPNQERRARRELLQQAEDFGPDFQVYLPMKLIEARPRTGMMGQTELISGPFFPRYMFARLDLRVEGWKAIWNTMGVHGMLGSLERPTCVADWVIERLRAQEDAGFIRIGRKDDLPKFQHGQRVRVADEMGFEGVFQQHVDAKRSVILVSCMGRDSRFTVDPRKLRAAEGS